MRLIVVGEAPVEDGARPWDGAAGRRLSSLGGLPDGYAALEHAAELRDLSARARPQGLGAAEARELAVALAPRLAGRPVVLCGSVVATALGLDDARRFEWRHVRWGPGVASVVAVVPHPSGRCREWNVPAVREQGERLLRAAFASPPVPDPSAYAVEVDLGAGGETMNTREAAALLGMPLRSFQRLAASDAFHVVRLGTRTHRYSRASLLAWRASRTS